MLQSFFQFGSIPANALHGSYNLNLVTLSYFIAVFASFIALDLAGRLRAETNKKWLKYWLLAGSFSMGTGIWSMHFIGMLAFVLPSPMDYDTSLTVLSLIVAIIASGFALYLFKSTQHGQFMMILGGFFLGLGIALMHYIGMEAMKIHMQIRYIPSIFFLSILIAIIASEAALWLVSESNKGGYKRQLNLKIASALVMGAAISGMHYVGMEAAVFTHDPSFVQPIKFLDPANLSFSIAFITLLILGITLTASTYKQIVDSASEKEFLKTMLYNLADGILACDAEGNLTLCNPAAQKIHGIPEANQILSSYPNYFKYFYSDGITPIKPEEHPFPQALDNKVISGYEMVVNPEDNNPRTVLVNGQAIIVDHKKQGAVIALHDITDYKEIEKQLIQQATHDLLTKLPNRMVLYDRIEQAISFAKRANKVVLVFFVDIDRFKIINDTLGHASGDELIKIVADRLQQSLRESDTIARFGGDEFVGFLNLEQDISEALPVIQRLLKSFNEPVLLGDREFKVTCSIGISAYPKDGEDRETLIKNADTAMYRAKENGRNNFQFYTEEINSRAKETLLYETELNFALERNEFILHYQPIADTNSGRISGLEALVRWNHPTFGLVPPLKFIPIAEESGLIIPIGEWVLKTACNQGRIWQSMDIPVKIAVNLSAVQFKQTQLDSIIARILHETGLEPSLLELELTESAIIENAESIIIKLNNLKKVGVRLVIDDFGTGYSNLSYLKRFPIDKLKIDKSFIQDVDSSYEDAAIVRAIISMANSLKMKVVAEGMESENQLKFLKIYQCDEMQGFFFSKPLTTEDCTQMLIEHFRK